MFEDCNKKQGSRDRALKAGIQRAIGAGGVDNGRGESDTCKGYSSWAVPDGALDASRNESNNGDTPPVETNRVAIPDPSDTLGDPVVEQTVRKLIETAGRLVANNNAPGSGVTAPSGTIDDTGRVQLSQTVIRQGISNVTPLMGSSRIPERKVRKMPAKKVSRIIDVQKNNQLKYSFTGVPETDRGPASIELPGARL